MARLLTVSNRLPVTVSRHQGLLRFEPSVGGLATGVGAVRRAGQALWIGWPGIAAEQLADGERAAVAERLQAEGCHPVFLTQRDIEDFYLGFANRTIWPLAHYFPENASYEERLWQAYRAANQAYCDAVVRVARPGDTIWIHDYHLMLLPRLIRDRLPGASVGFFLHIPFPAFEIYRQLPWRRPVVEGLLGADVVGFQTQDHVHHFLDCVARLTGLEPHRGHLAWDGRLIRVDAFPIGIDFGRYADTVGAAEVQTEVERMRAQFRGRRVVLSVDRLDYSKGLPQRLEAYDLFLTRHPEYREQVTLVVLAVPSRTEVAEYQALKRVVQERVGDINGRYGTLGWVPVWYLYRSVPFNSLVALYQVADVGLVTPLRDGMNLVAKEFVAAQPADAGVLILSEMAGAAREMVEAIIVNPYNIEETADAIAAALRLPEGERRARIDAMQLRLRQYTVQRWAATFLQTLRRTTELRARIPPLPQVAWQG